MSASSPSTTAKLAVPSESAPSSTQFGCGAKRWPSMRPSEKAGTPGAGRGCRSRVAPAASAGDEERGADRAAEVAERCDPQRRRAVVDEEGLGHLLHQRVPHAFAEADAEAAPEDHRFDVEQVDRGGDAGAERLDRALDQLLGELVPVVERALPDAAGQPRFVVLLHQLEEVGLLTVLVPAPRLGFHRRTARVGLEAALAAAGALGAAALDHHVADLPRR